MMARQACSTTRVSILYSHALSEGGVSSFEIAGLAAMRLGSTNAGRAAQKKETRPSEDLSE
jgi:hypothetical protein